MKRRWMVVTSLLLVGLALAVIGVARTSTGGAPSTVPEEETAAAARPDRGAWSLGHEAPSPAPPTGIAALALEVPREQVLRSLTAAATALTPDQREEVDTIVKAMQEAGDAAHVEATPAARARLESQIRAEGERALATVLDEQQKDQVRQYMEGHRRHP